MNISFLALSGRAVLLVMATVLTAPWTTYAPGQQTYREVHKILLLFHTYRTVPLITPMIPYSNSQVPSNWTHFF